MGRASTASVGSPGSVQTSVPDVWYFVEKMGWSQSSSRWAGPWGNGGNEIISLTGKMGRRGSRGDCIVEEKTAEEWEGSAEDGQTSFDYVVDIRAVLSEKRAKLINIEREVMEQLGASVDADGCCTQGGPSVRPFYLPLGPGPAV
ncbi:hypothetical protein DHEL01_v211595 [Diaporthe helianthi]|uniref:Uncharacterized protein n=1 Tax=Diaporthe helianthi TaxID=158607 RepID=A0A2P5HIE5_DIAHE|nr:hypothetical protein DHEL01_v211595 [Diaporthe helianthi]